MNIKVSVIIPVFNAEKYILECIESLINQTLSDCEFIFVNDGSEDSSRQIIKHYQNSDSRIKLINQENQGVSVARNNGLKIATGEYIGFVDADDFIEKDMYETLYDSAKKHECDVIISNIEGEMNGHMLITAYPFPINTPLNKNYIQTEILRYFLKYDNLNSVCNKIYKYQTIANYNIGFTPNVALGEDGMFNILFLSHASTLIYIDYTGYHYREAKKSATRDISNKDYFSRAIEVYNSKLPHIYSGVMEYSEIKKLQSTKLLNNVLAYAHLYFEPSKSISFRKRFNYVRNMIHNRDVRIALKFSLENINENPGIYERFLILMIKRKSTMGLYWLTT